MTYSTLAPREVYSILEDTLDTAGLAPETVANVAAQLAARLTSEGVRVQSIPSDYVHTGFEAGAL